MKTSVQPVGVRSVMRYYAQSWEIKTEREFVQIGIPDECRGLFYEIGTTLDYINAQGIRCVEFRQPHMAPVEFIKIDPRRS